ncbi:phage major capsid protein [Rhizobium sp. FY34]|uniref:phage major capsid protein n=1 Tax=Rhizobium sp. FY34 TaxID=2562309 RepID=UPI0010C0F067|nr:phage major capsid protein [Rhizobium sp. FY34]
MDLNDLKDLITLQGKAFDGVKAKLDGIDAAIAAERKEREELEAKMNRVGMFGGNGSLPGLPGSKRSAGLVAEHKALDTFIRTGDETELKTLRAGSDPDGGYTVLPNFSAGMTQRLFDISPMRRLARFETIGAGDSFEEIDDRGEAGATWVSESEGRPATTTPQIGKWRIPAHEIYSLQPVTQRLLDDTSRDLGAWIETKISDKFGRSEGSSFVNADGAGKPRGFLSYPTTEEKDFVRAAGKLQFVKSGAAAGFATSAAADALKSLMWSLRAPYRAGAVWMMNSNTASIVDKFKDGQGNYIWRDGMTAGAPPSLLGYAVEINEDMPDVAANAFPIAFGNFPLSYCIVEKPGIKMLRDPYTSKPNVLFYGYRRVGGGVTNDDALKLLKIAE